MFSNRGTKPVQSWICGCTTPPPPHLSCKTPTPSASLWHCLHDRFRKPKQYYTRRMNLSCSGSTCAGVCIAVHAIQMRGRRGSCALLYWTSAVYNRAYDGQSATVSWTKSAGTFAPTGHDTKTGDLAIGPELPSVVTASEMLAHKSTYF